MATPTKRKLYATKTIADKYAAVLDVEKGASKKDVAERHGIPRTTLAGWLKQKEKIKEAFDSGSFGSKTKRLRTSSKVRTEEALLRWVTEARAANVPITGAIMTIKARAFAQELGEDDNIDESWVYRFRLRHGIVWRGLQGEARSVDDSVADEFKTTILPRLLEDYDPDDIYNADETGLNYLATTNKTMTFKTDDCRGTKQSKARITVLVCANMTGTDKRPLLTIGRFNKPRCFRGRHLPCGYTANRRSWMTSEVWTSWISRWDRQLVREGRKVVLVIDNAPGHPQVPLDAIKVVFLPPNTTASTQPMDQGVIQNLKAHYRKTYTLDHLCPALEKKQPLQFTLLDALEVVTQAWQLVTPRTVARCFRHAGFQHPDINDTDDDDDDIPLSQLAVKLTEAGLETTPEEVHRILHEEEGLQTSGGTTDAEIVAQVSATEATECEDLTEGGDDDDDDEPEPSHADFVQAMRLVRRYAGATPGSKGEDFYRAACALSRQGSEAGENRKKQVTMHRFLPTMPSRDAQKTSAP